MSQRPRRDIAEALSVFTRALSDEQSVEHVFRTLGDYCTELLHVDGVGILLLVGEDLVVATTNSEPGDAAEHLEAELREGPCCDSVRTGSRVLVPDLEAEAHRWPRFAPRAIEAGVRSIHGLPIGGWSGLPIGSLDIVTSEPRQLSDEDLRIADMLVDVAVTYLVGIRAYEQASELATQLQHALDSRVVIEQAKGVLRGRHGYGFQEAFERLRGHARSDRRRIQEVSRDVCDGVLDLD